MVRLKRKIQENFDEKQYGRKDCKGTRNFIFVLKMMLERSLGMQKDVYLCFVDFKKAFDTVKHTQMLEMQRNRK